MNKKINFLEKNNQNSAIKIFQSMGYTYISPEECVIQREGKYNVLLKNILCNQLCELNHYTYAGENKKFSQNSIERAIAELDMPLSNGLIKTSEKIYNTLIMGNVFQEEVGEGQILNFDFQYIDWKHMERNVFHVTDNFEVENKDKNRNTVIDTVLFVNGIPFVAIECKNFNTSVNQVIDYLNEEQQDGYIPHLFKFMQILAVYDGKMIHYSTIGSQKSYWYMWKDKDPFSMFKKIRILELIQHFIFYSLGGKNICAPHQYSAVMKTVETISKKDELNRWQGGILSQPAGTGKTGSMVALAKYILSRFAEYNPQVILAVTHKIEEMQLESLFFHSQFTPIRATSGKHLMELLNKKNAELVLTISSKINAAANTGIKCNSNNVFILLNEYPYSNDAHILKMICNIFPNACLVAFSDIHAGIDNIKEKDAEKKAGDKLIYKYSFCDGIEDRVLLPVIYENRNFYEKDDDEHIPKVAKDINIHFTESLKSIGFKAMLLVKSEQDAKKYLDYFDRKTYLKSTVYPKENVKDDFSSLRDINIFICKRVSVGLGIPHLHTIYFDSPITEYKLSHVVPMVNRLDIGKDYGLFIDYCTLPKEGDTIVEHYVDFIDKYEFNSACKTKSILDIKTLYEQIQDYYDEILKQFYEVADITDSEAVEVFLSTKEKRNSFYDALCAYGRTLNLVMNSKLSSRFLLKSDLDKYEKMFVYFSKVRRNLKIRYGDGEDNDDYEPVIQNLLDQHFPKEGMKNITNYIVPLDDKDFCEKLDYLNSPRAKGDAINSYLLKKIEINYDENRLYYDSFLKRLQNIKDNFNTRKIQKDNYFEQMLDILDDYGKAKVVEEYPDGISDNKAAKMYYGVILPIFNSSNLEFDVPVDLVAEISEAIADIVSEYSAKQLEESRNTFNSLAQKIDDLFFKLECENRLTLPFDVIDQVIENVKLVATGKF